MHDACFDDPGHLDIDYDLHDIADESTSRASHLDAGVDETGVIATERDTGGFKECTSERIISFPYMFASCDDGGHLLFQCVLIHGS